MHRITDLKIEAMNVAIPVALIGTNDEGQLEFTFYVQLPDGFLFKGHLQQAVEASIATRSQPIVKVQWAGITPHIQVLGRV